jgi:hypothetical protein
VRQPGGEVGGLGLHVEGAFRAAPGDEVVLFLRHGRDGVLAPIGMQQGAFRVERPRGGVPVAVRDLGGVVVPRRAGARPASREALPLAVVVTRVGSHQERRAR